MKATPVDSMPQSDRENAPAQEKPEAMPTKQMSSVEARPISENPKKIDLPELSAQEARPERAPAPARAGLENPSLHANGPALAPGQDIPRETPRQESREDEPSRLELKKIQMLLSEQQQATMEQFERLHQEQQRLAERVALISHALQRQANKVASPVLAPEAAELVVAELPKPEEAQKQEAEQMQKADKVQPMPLHTGERRSLAEAFKQFKNLN